MQKLKISISRVVVIHVLNNLDSRFRSYLAILSHDAREKKKLPSLTELAKTLENGPMRLWNENTGTPSYARRSKSKKAKPSELGSRGETEKGLDNGEEKKSKRWGNARHVEGSIGEIS